MSAKGHCVMVDEPYSRLELAMDLRGLSPQDLAKAVGVNPQEVLRWQKDGIPETHLHAVTLRLCWPHTWFNLEPLQNRLIEVGVPITGQHCRWCAADAAYLCDEPMPDGGTCDRAVCRQHSTRVDKDQHRCPDHRAGGGR